MTVETAYAAFVAAVAAALADPDVGFITAADQLHVDPEAPIELAGDVESVETAASVEKVETRPVRQILGRPEQRWLVERSCRVELQAVGPARADRLQVDARAVAALALLPSSMPTLSGACERLILVGCEDEILPPNGVAKIFAFTLRVRSGDPLGMSA